MDVMTFMNELLQAFGFYCMALFEIDLLPGVTYGAALISIAIISIFMRIIIVRLKNG